MGRSPNDLLDVWKYIDTQGGNKDACWPWTGPTSGRDGDRGYLSIAGRKHQAHVIVFELVHGPLAEGELVRHKCDNGLCCNPYHLESGTRGDNERDKYKRDRAGLPVVVVREIRRLLETSTATQAEIALRVSVKFGVQVSREAVRNIKLGKRRTEDELTADEVEEIKPHER